MATTASETIQNIGRWLGGLNRVKAMVGTTNFVYSNDENWLMFDFKMCKKANKVRITYVPATDLYRVEFFKVNFRKLESKTVAEYDGVYGEDLKRFFEEETGLYLSL